MLEIPNQKRTWEEEGWAGRVDYLVLLCLRLLFVLPSHPSNNSQKWRKSKTCVHRLSASIAAAIISHTLLRPAQKLNNLRAEADASIERAEAAEAKNKKLEMELLAREQEITSLSHKLNVMEGDLEKAEAKLADAKNAREDGDSAKSTAENLQRKIQILEEELDNAEKNLKETVEKCVFVDSCCSITVYLVLIARVSAD